MITVYFAQTDSTGHTIRYFTNRDEAIAWVEDHRAAEGYVASFTLGELTLQAVVDLLNEADFDRHPVYEVSE